jgi:hypothetical protein
MYTRCFTTFFKLLSECVQNRIGWKHLHTGGIIGVTIDMDEKQMSGRYMNSFLTAC